MSASARTARRTAADSPRRPGFSRRARCRRSSNRSDRRLTISIRRASATESSTVQPPSVQSVAEMRTKSGDDPARPRAPRSTVSQRKRMRFSKRAAVFIGALVAQRREKTVQQIAVRRVDLDDLRARLRARAAPPAQRRRESARSRRDRAPAASDSRRRKAARSGRKSGSSRPSSALTASRLPTAARCSPCVRHARAASPAPRPAPR